MSKRRSKAEITPEFIESIGAEIAASMLPLQCSGEGCMKRTSLMLPGDSPYKEAMILHDGWTVIVGDKPPSLDFFCRECYDKVVESGEVDDP